MLEWNKAKMNYLNVNTWRNAGLSGDGVKILVIDNDFDLSKTYLRDIVIPCGRSGREDYVDPWWGATSLHGLYCLSVIHMIAPNATLYFASHRFGEENAINYALEHDVDIVSASWTGAPRNAEALFCQLSRKAALRNIYLFSSAGNWSQLGVTFPANTPEWIAVAACTLKNGVPTRKDYSSIGEELEISCFTDLYVSGRQQDEQHLFTGTSCACPAAAAITALAIEAMDYKPTVEEFRTNWLYPNCEDLQEPGDDIYTGYGLYKLPEKAGTKKNTWPIYNIKTFVARLYQYLLDRNPDSAGLDYWTRTLLTRHNTVNNVVMYFTSCDEFVNKQLSNEEFITRLYKALLQREPDDDGMTYWLQVLHGMPRHKVVEKFLYTPEFRSICIKYNLD